MVDSTRVDATLELGGRLATARRRHGMTQAAVAQLVGRSEDWLRRIEAGQRGIAVADLARVAEVTHADFAALLGPVAPASLYTRPEHPALGQVRAALAGVGGPGDGAAGDVRVLVTVLSPAAICGLAWCRAIRLVRG